MAKASTASDLAPFSIPTQGWASGVNIRDAPNMIQPDEARVMENGILDEKGDFSKRLGSISLGTFGVGTDRALSLYTFYRAGVTPQVLMHTTGGKLYYSVDPFANPIVWTQIATGLSTTARFSFETFNGKAYMGNGVDNFASWDGTTYTTFPSAPKGKFLRLWKDTLFIAGISGFPDRVYESAAGDPETWPVASWVDIAKGDGDQTTALGTDGFVLMVFKRQRHMAIIDPVTLQNRVVDFEKGCESHFSVIQFESYVYFLSRRGICRYLSDQPSDLISYKIDPLFDPQVLNFQALDSAWAYSYETRVSWALPEIGNIMPTVQIDYYPRLGPLSPLGYRALGPWAFSRLPANVFTRVRSGQNDQLFGAKITENKVLQLFAASGTDDGVQFAAILETGQFDFGAPSRTKYLRRIRVLGRGRFNCQLKRNYGSATYRTFLVDLTATTDTWNIADTWGTGTWGPDSVVKETVLNPDAYGRAFQIRFSDAETALGTKQLNVGANQFALNAGEWAIFLSIMDGEVLGMRD